MKHGSLFSGIGGFDLAAEWMGWENMFHCEWNEFGQKVLHHYWPNAETFTDITKSDFKKYYGTIDILTGGFPCQPYSSAGKRKGKEDERHLWPEMLRAIREISPRFVVGENVRGLTNWNGGLVFDEVCTELETLGYQVAPVIIPACALNAPHKRERIWFVAYNYNNGSHGTKDRQSMGQRNERNQKRQDQTIEFKRCSKEDASFTTYAESVRRDGGGSWYGQDINKDKKGICEYRSEWSEMGAKSKRHSQEWNATDTEIKRLERLRREERGYSKLCRRYNGIQNWDNFPTESPVCGGDDGLPNELDGITFSKWRSESIKAYGNAIVPQVAYQIFKAIEQTINK